APSARPTRLRSGRRWSGRTVSRFHRFRPPVPVSPCKRRTPSPWLARPHHRSSSFALNCQQSCHHACQCHLFYTGAPMAAVLVACTTDPAPPTCLRVGRRVFVSWIALLSPFGVASHLL